VAEIIGPQTLLNKALPTGVDGTRVAEWTLRDGLTYGELINRVALGVGDFNQEMVNDWGWTFGLTEELMMEYEQGGAATEMPEITDIDDITTIHGETIGHMIDFKHYGRAVASSLFYLRDARSVKIQSAINVLVRQARERFEKSLLTRWLTNTENLIGTGGYDVPFVRGTGGNVDFAPPAYDGENFTTAHNHYLGIDSGSFGYDGVLDQMAETLAEHGHMAPFTALIAKADIASYMALTGFVEVVDPVINIVDRGGETSGNQFYAVGQRPFGLLGYYQGQYGLVEVRYTNRVPTTYAGMTKSYGQLDTRNGLAVRVHPDVGFGAYILPETTLNDDYPIKKLDVVIEFGMGCGMDRTNGAAAYLVAGGVWVNPTIG
jgi:hypothetical protein